MATSGISMSAVRTRICPRCDFTILAISAPPPFDSRDLVEPGLYQVVHLRGFGGGYIQKVSRFRAGFEDRSLRQLQDAVGPEIEPGGAVRRHRRHERDALVRPVDE